MLSITEAEQATGIGKDTLRVWERRYGFPRPEREASGKRLYTRDQIEKLCLIKRLIDAGNRPSRLVSQTTKDLQKLLQYFIEAAPSDKLPSGQALETLTNLTTLIKNNKFQEVRSILNKKLLIEGIDLFVCNTIAPLTFQVGEAWANSEISIFQEHQYTELIENILRSAIADIQRYYYSAGPSVLLATFPNELHTLGLLMAECMFVTAGARCLTLGAHVPISEIVAAALAHKPEIIALSFSVKFNRSDGQRGISELRKAVPDTIDIWVGGRAHFLDNLQIVGVQVVQSLDSISSRLGMLGK